MRVLYDHQIFSNQTYGGISRYFFELMNNFDKYKDINFKLSLQYSNNDYIKKSNFSNHKEVLKNFNFRGKYRLLNFLNKPNSIEILKRQDFDIFHPTYYDPYFLKYIGRKPFVLTIHDMIHEIYPKMFSKKDKTSELKKLLAQKADIIIAISENTKKDILRFCDVDKNKVEVIYHGNSIEKNRNVNVPSIKLPDNFMLFVGNRKGYKNFDYFLRSIGPLLENNVDLYLVCVGGGKFSESEIYLVEKLNIKNNILQYSIDDRILSYFYKKARFFVFPSLYEGFGIPILESFSCGCPVALSNTSSFPEVAGDAGLYFDPGDELSIREAISKMIYSKEIRKNLQSKGFEQLEKFSWRKTAKETLNIYRCLI